MKGGVGVGGLIFEHCVVGEAEAGMGGRGRCC